MTYREDKAWEEFWIPHVIDCIQSRHYLRQADEDTDQHACGDISLVADNVVIGVRIRRPSYLSKYPNDVTFRSWRDNEAETELSKISRGLGNLFFYGFANENWEASPELSRWCLISLESFRNILQRYPALHRRRVSNSDGTYFCPVNIQSLNSLFPDVVVDSNWLNKK